MRMRRRGEGRGVACPRLSPGGGVAMATAPRSAAMEVTGSRFCGSTERGRMEGWGSYTLPTGTEYLGELRDGAFHGRGALLFPGGGTFRAVWHRGVPAETASNTRLKGGITATATTGGSTPRSARGSDPQVPTCGAAPHRPARGGGAARQRHRAEAVTSRAERAVGGRAAIPGEPKRTFCPARTAHEKFLALLRSAGAAFAVPAESHTAGKRAVCSYPVLPVHFSVFSIGKIARTFYKTGCKETMFLWQTPGRCNTS
eukprot:XP_015135327.1 MORN repeat-containing protein 5 isoform X4 [Gallus gallus]